MRALVAMSGGVDSSVAAAIMRGQGHEVIGVTLKQWTGENGIMPTAGCCTVGDAEDARRVAAQLDIDYYVLDYVQAFTAAVVDRFADEYASGRTPNPCIECNRRIRFHALLERAGELGCEVLVTGHHARVDHDGTRYRLLAGVDDAKDQSYVLHMLGQHQLSRIRLPIGELTKAEVRQQAADLGLRTAAKPDSQDLCFIGRGGYRSFLEGRLGETAGHGEIVDTAGNVLGTHRGTVGFTIGQRKGIGVPGAEPRYVVAIRPETRTVVVGTREELAVAGCTLDDVSFVAGEPPRPAVEVKVRYRTPAVGATLGGGPGAWSVRFDEPQIGVAPGQAAVLYRGAEVLGGGTIAATVPAAPNRVTVE